MSIRDNLRFCYDRDTIVTNVRLIRLELYEYGKIVTIYKLYGEIRHESVRNTPKRIHYESGTNKGKFVTVLENC